MRDWREEMSATVQVPVGSERSMKLPDSRLSGRPDRIERDSAGVFHVTDLKTGAVLDKDGQPLGDYALQVRLYGLMVERIDPDARVRLWLEGSERVEVPWNGTTRAETEELLDTTLSDLPADRSLPTPSRERDRNAGDVESVIDVLATIVWLLRGGEVRRQRPRLLLSTPRELCSR
jgi:RecB family exonuclease